MRNVGPETDPVQYAAVVADSVRALLDIAIRRHAQTSGVIPQLNSSGKRIGKKGGKK